MERLDHPQMYLPEFWAAHARWRPNREAIVRGGRRLTWGEFNRGMNRVAGIVQSYRARHHFDCSNAVGFRGEFPRNALGKVLKRFLREPYWRAVG